MADMSTDNIEDILSVSTLHDGAVTGRDLMLSQASTKTLKGIESAVESENLPNQAVASSAASHFTNSDSLNVFETDYASIEPIERTSLDVSPDLELDQLIDWNCNLDSLPSDQDVVAAALADAFDEEEVLKTQQEEEEKDQPSESEAETEKMDLSLRGSSSTSISIEAVEGLLKLSGKGFEPVIPNGSESAAESIDSFDPPRNKRVKRKSGQSSSSDNNRVDSGDGSTPVPNKSSSGRSSRRKKKTFLHQKDDPTDPIAQRARYAKTYRERKKQEHEKEVNALKKEIEGKDAQIKRLQSENDAMKDQLTKMTLSRQQTVKFASNIVAVIKTAPLENPELKGIDIRISPELGDLNSPKLSDEECAKIARNAKLSTQRVMYTFDISESDKQLKILQEPH